MNCNYIYLHKYLTITIIFIEYLIICESTAISENYQVEFLHMLFRHGDRTPIQLYPNDPYAEDVFYPEGLGQLTLAGKVRAYELGAKLRNQYGKYLGNIYKHHEVMARSSDCDRTKMSLMLVLSSLYPPKDKQIWNPTLNWQPIPFSYYPKHLDILFVPNESLLKLAEELKRVEGLEEMKMKVKKFYPLMKNLTRWTGIEVDSVEKIFYLYHSLIAEYSMGLELPDWARSIIPHGQILWEAAVFHYQMRSYNSKLRRLNGGMLLKNIIDTMTGIANDTINDGRKIQLFSGHESNIAYFLMTLGIFKPHVPEYSSCVIVELLRNKYKEYYVGMRYYLGIPPKIKVLEIPGCDMNPCPLDKFVHLMMDVTPTDDDMILIDTKNDSSDC